MFLPQFKKDLDFYEDYFNDFILTGSIVLRCLDIIKRPVKDLDLIVNEEIVVTKDFTKLIKQDNLFCKKHFYKHKGYYSNNCILLKEKDFDTIEVEINNKIYKAMSAENIILNKYNILNNIKTKRSKLKHLSDIDKYLIKKQTNEL